MSSAAYSFTPVRRRDAYTRKHASGVSESKIWTAARCHRLLRPIRSRIELLRSDASQNPSNNSLHGLTQRQCYATQQNRVSNPASGNKKSRRTYGGRYRTSHRVFNTPSGNVNKAGQLPAPVPGEIYVPTPILNRARDEAICIEDEVFKFGGATANGEKTRRPQARYMTKDGEAHHQLGENLRRMKRTMQPARFALYDGLYNALETLLKATNAKEVNTTCRSKSLFSMCLRTIPRRIKEEEEWAIESAREQGGISSLDMPDPSTQTYSDLESYGCTEVGWNQLAILARAHGVQCVSDAISNGLIDTDFASAMVMLCVHTASPNEAEILLTSLVGSSTYPCPPYVQSRFGDDAALLALSTLQEYSKYTGRTAYLHRQVMQLIITRKLPITWLATSQMSWVWTSIFRSLSINRDDRDATAFMVEVLPLMAEAHSSSDESNQSPSKKMLLALHTTLKSVLTTLTAIAILSCGRGPQVPQSLSAALGKSNMIMQILPGLIIDCGLFRSKLSGSGAGLLAIAAMAIHGEKAKAQCVEDVDFSRELTAVLRRIPGRKDICVNQDLQLEPSMFLCSIARCAGRASANGPFDFLRLICENIRAREDDGQPGETIALRQLIVDTAYIFAQQIPDRAHIEYAENLAIVFHEDPVQLQSSPSRKTGPSFRWEEGISEWVTATPAVTQRTAWVFRDSSPENESECDTPFRPAVKRRKVMKIKADFQEATDKTFSHSASCLSDLIPEPSIEHQTVGDPPSVADTPVKAPLAGAQSRQRIGLHVLRESSARHSPAWEPFNDSDDELSCPLNSGSKCTGPPILRELTHLNGRYRRVTKTSRYSALKRQPLWGADAPHLEESEDELG